LWQEDPAFPVPAEGYMVTFVAFYERGFGVPSHQFLHSLLWQYGLELHNLPPLGVLHIVVFVTLCGAYMGIDPSSTCGTVSSMTGVRRTQTQS
jgi:hypothetical protein